jgi:hypothetical protein
MANQTGFNLETMANHIYEKFSGPTVYKPENMVSLSAEAKRQRSREAEHELQLSNKANITCYLFYKIPQPL